MKFSPINSKIIFLISLQIGLIILSVLILTNFESQNTLLGNSINVASNNLQLVDQVLFEMEKHRIGEPFVAKPTLALNNLNDNINVLKDGGNTQGLKIAPLPEQFNSIWDELHIEYLNFASTSKQISNIKDSGKVITELDILFLEDSKQVISEKSVLLTSEITKYTEERSQTLIYLQVILAIINIGVHLFLIFLIVRILEMELLTQAEYAQKIVRAKKEKYILSIMIVGISILVLTGWMFLIVPELKNNISSFEIINQRIGSDRIVAEIGENLPEPIRTRDLWKQEVINQEGNNLEIHSTITTNNLVTDEIIFKSERVFLVDQKTKTHIEDTNKFFMFPNNVEKKTYEFIHPLIYFPAKFVFEGEDEIEGVPVYVFSCNPSGDDISYAYPQFSQKILSDSSCKVWVEPITGIELWFEKTWHDYHQSQNQVFSIDKGSSKTSEYTKDVLIDAVHDRIKLYTFYDTIIPILLVGISAGSFLVVFVNQNLKIRTKELSQTRRKKTEQVLYEIIPDCVVTFDKNDRLEDCNKKIVDALGFSKDELIGMHELDFYDDKEQKKVAKLLQRIRGGEQIMGVDLHIKRKDGSFFHSVWNAVPMFDDNNEYIGYVTTGVDLTQTDKLKDELARKEKFEIEKELQEVKKKKTAEVLYEVIPDCVITNDKNNRLENCNKKFADTFGYSKDELIGMHVLDLVVEEEREMVSGLLQRISKGEKMMETELHGKRKDGSSFHSVWNAIPMFDDNNEYIGFSSTGIDLTEIDKLKDDLVKKEKFETLGELAANLAHDIKNPVNELMSFLQIKYHHKFENIKEEELAEQISYWFFTSFLISRTVKRKPIDRLLQVLKKDQELNLWYMKFYKEAKMFYEKRLTSILKSSA